VLRPMTLRHGIAAVAIGALLLAGCSGASGGDAMAPRHAVPQSSPVEPSRADSPSAESPPAESTSAESTPAESTPAESTSAESTPAGPVVASPSLSGSPLVVLNPGHNGGNSTRPDIVNSLVPAGNGATKACDTAGTTTVDGYPEHSFTFDVATRVAELLIARGVRVELTRADDSSVGPCVDERAALGNGPEVAAVVSIHADGAPESGHGFHISQASIPPAGAQVAAESDRLTSAVHDAMAAESGLTTSTYLGSDGYFPRSDLAGLSLAQRPATFLECGNMKNPDDAALQSSPAGRAQIAAAIADGILAFLAA
jgi:N-acetylmuramoyl-L-alanine amidase